MNDAPERSDPEPQPPATPYLRLPMPLVAGALLVFLVGLLALGLYANRNLRPQGIVVPTAAVQAAPSETPPAVVAANPTVTPAPVVATTAATPLTVSIATSTPDVPPHAPPVPSAPAAATVNTTPLPTVEPILAAEVGKAYEHFWQVRSQAELTLDSSHLSDVMSGRYLEHFLDVLSQLQSEGKAIKVQVGLNYTVVQATDDLAVVHDRLEDGSVYVQLGTNVALSDPVNDVQLTEFTLARLDGAWKVVDSVAES